jgi:hypothetical protein
MRGHVRVFYFRYYPDSNRPVSDLRLGVYSDIGKADIGVMSSGLSIVRTLSVGVIQC